MAAALVPVHALQPGSITSLSELAEEVEARGYASPVVIPASSFHFMGNYWTASSPDLLSHYGYWSGQPEADGVEVHPYLAFRANDEEIIHCGENAYTYEFVYGAMKKLFHA